METIHIFSPNVKDAFSDNSRQHIRKIRKDVSVIVKRNLLSTEPNSTFLLDISTHGVSICCRKRYSNKARLRLKLTFAENVNFDLEGEIRHIQKKEMVDKPSGKKINYYQYGIQFIDQPPKFSEYLLETSLKNKFCLLE